MRSRKKADRLSGLRPPDCEPTEALGWSLWAGIAAGSPTRCASRERSVVLVNHLESVLKIVEVVPGIVDRAPAMLCL
jgi:hypothetical protein